MRYMPIHDPVLQLLSNSLHIEHTASCTSTECRHWFVMRFVHIIRYIHNSQAVAHFQISDQSVRSGVFSHSISTTAPTFSRFPEIAHMAQRATGPGHLFLDTKHFIWRPADSEMYYL